MKDSVAKPVKAPKKVEKVAVVAETTTDDDFDFAHVPVQASSEMDFMSEKVCPAYYVHFPLQSLCQRLLCSPSGCFC